MKNNINISNLTSLISCTNGSGFGTFNRRSKIESNVDIITW